MYMSKFSMMYEWWISTFKCISYRYTIDSGGGGGGAPKDISLFLSFETLSNL